MCYTQRPKYTNPWPSYRQPSVWQLLRTALVRKGATSDVDLPAPPLTHPATFSRDVPKEPRVMWLGHAGVYVQLPTSDGLFGILYDPIFSKRCSPSKLFGPKRRIPPPCKVQDLPAVHLVLISHDHYDHLDEATLRAIEKHHKGVRYLVPTGVKDILVGTGIEEHRVTEMSWWDSSTVDPCCAVPNKGDESPLPRPRKKSPVIDVDIPSGKFDHEDTNSLPSSPLSAVFSETTLHEQPSITVTCCPSQHNSGRNIFRRNSTLWASWYLTCRLGDEQTCRIYFAGDTGYRSSPDGPVCPIFRDISSSLGAPDLALIPIAAGACLPFIEHLFKVRLNITAMTRHIHASPEDAAAIHRDLQARQSLAIHWGTFTTALGAKRTRDEFEHVRPTNFVATDVGVWLPVVLPKEIEVR